jgi:hypothetical protein
MSEPTTEEMQAAWEVFKRWGLFAVLLGHMAPATVLDNEGVLWGIFYNGYMACHNYYCAAVTERPAESVA